MTYYILESCDYLNAIFEYDPDNNNFRLVYIKSVSESRFRSSHGDSLIWCDLSDSIKDRTFDEIPMEGRKYQILTKEDLFLELL